MYVTWRLYSMHDQISVNDIGLDNITAADGLAVGSASGFVGRAMQQLIDGYYTIHDECLYELIALLNQTENIQVEPSAAAGMMYIMCKLLLIIWLCINCQLKSYSMRHMWYGRQEEEWFHLMKCKSI